MVLEMSFLHHLTSSHGVHNLIMFVIVNLIVADASCVSSWRRRRLRIEWVVLLCFNWFPQFSTEATRVPIKKKSHQERSMWNRACKGREQYWWFFIDGYGLKIFLRSDRRWATDELALSKMRLAGGQKQNRTFPGSILLLESLLWLIRLLFGGFP